MASRYASSTSSNSDTVVNPTVSSSNSSSQNYSTSQSTSSSKSFTGIQDEEALTILKEFIRQLASGGTKETKAANAERQQIIEDTRATASDYTKDQAFADAQALVAQSLQDAAEKNAPAIARSIQGAGTSASSMQSLLSQKQAAEAAQTASALGAQQAVSYGGISANLAAVLEKLTQADTTNETSLINALALLKNTESSSEFQSSSYSQGTSQSSSSSSGGGTSRVSSSGTPATSASTPTVDDYAIDFGTYSYLVNTTPAAFADFTTDNGYTSESLPSGYMSITNTTDNNSSSDNFYDYSYDYYDRYSDVFGVY
jgi:hypothetical protein